MYVVLKQTKEGYKTFGPIDTFWPRDAILQVAEGTGKYVAQGRGRYFAVSLGEWQSGCFDYTKARGIKRVQPPARP